MSQSSTYRPSQSMLLGRWAPHRRKSRGALAAALLLGHEVAAVSAALNTKNRTIHFPEYEEEEVLYRGRRLPIWNDATGATLGVRAPCRGVNCIQSQRWDCFFALEGDGSVQNCIFSWKDDGARPGWSVYAGDRSLMTWTDLYGPDQLTVSGQLQSGDSSMNPTSCGVAKPYTWPVFDMTSSGDMLVADTLTAATLPPVRPNVTTPFTLAACYCNSFDIDATDPPLYCVGNLGALSDRCCGKYTEYLQMVGVVYYWTMRICDMSNYAGTRSTGSSAGCASYYRRVLPQQQFVLRIECPPGGGCKGDDNNLVKFIEGGPSYPDNNLPSWSDTNPCNNAAEPASVVWPTATATESLSGGTRVDYKVWSVQRPKLNKGVSQQVDVCFSNTNLPKYYVKVGSVKTSTAFAIASKFPPHWDPANTVNMSTVRYAGYNGSFTLYGGISGTQPSPYDSNTFSGKALAYFMSYDRELLWGQGANQQTLEKYLGLDQSMPSNMQTLLDNECRRYRLSSNLASPNPLPMAQVAGTDSSNSQYHTFSGISQRQYLRVNLAGVVAVCYCAMVGDNNQCDPANWYFATRITIQGPTGGQTWQFDTNLVVKLSVSGWGLSANDRLRIIGSSSSCSDMSGNPTGDRSFKTGCPATGGLGCTYAGTSTDITLNALTWQNAGMTVSSIEVFDTYSYLTFSGNVQGVLNPGDVITMDYASIAVNGKAQGTELPAEKYEMYRLSGEYIFQDTLRSGETVQKYLVGHRLSSVDSNGDGIPDSTKFQIPIGWPLATRPTFTFPPGGGLPGGRWMRRNLVQTAEEIKGMTATTSPLKVCWGVNGNAGATYYQQAGTIQFTTPAAMSAARVFLTTKKVGAIAPAVIFFKTDPTRTQYSTVTGKTKLMLRFLDVRDTEGKLVPLFAQDVSYTCPGNGGCPDEIPGDDQVQYSDMRQFLCGKLFSELWSDDLEGFPVPLGCYYSQKLLDGPNPTDALTTNSNLFYREISIVFGARNGLRSNTRYMLVLNTRAPTAMNPTLTPIPIVDLYAMCAEDTGCDRPYMVIEKGTATLGTNSQTVAGGGSTDPQLGQGGFTILSSDGTGTLSLSDLNILQFKLMGGTGQQAIRAQSIIRIYLWPLTSWSIGEAACTARCIPYFANSAAQCSGTVGCRPEAVVDPKLNSAYNVVRITLPSAMTDITQTTQHTIQVYSLTLPQSGFFPTRLGVQLTRDDDSAPQYTTSNGFIWKYPEFGQTEGRLVLTDRTGYGPKPFAGDRDNSLVIRIQFGATLWNWGETGLASMFEVQLPPGYTCAVATTDNGAPLSTLPVFLADSNGDGFPDNDRGILAVNTADGDWLRSSGQSCFYEVKKWNRIFARQVVYVALTVQNPATPFQKGDSQNVWKLKLSSKGADSTSVTPGGKSMPYVQFTNNSDILNSKDPNVVKFFTGNAAVLKELVLPLIQPASTTNSMTRSCCGTTYDQRRSTQFLRVFFAPGISVGQRGYVVVDAPDGFDFGSACVVQDLSPEYYAYAGDQQVQLKRLTPPLVCTGSQYPVTASSYNRASIWVTGSIDVQPLQTYGFQVQVTNPSFYLTTQQSDGWRLWTQDSSGYALEGSRTTVKFNPKQAPTQTLFYHQSWGLYADAETGYPLIQIGNMQPYVISNNQDATVVVFPIVFATAVVTSLRITAPLDFIWNTDFSNYRPNTNCTVGVPCENFGGGSGVLPQVQGTVTNALVWTTVTFNANVRYGFQHKIRIPILSPRVSANAFFFEYGFDQPAITDRLRAAAVEAPRVAALVNCKVGYNSNQVGITDNRMQFQLETITRIPLNGGIVIDGDTNTKGFTFVPQYTMLDGSAPFPADITIQVIMQTDGTPMIMIKVQANPIPPGLYKFEMAVNNPTQRVLVPGQWTFGTYRDVSSYPDKKYIDNEMVAPGFVINRRMQYADFYPLNARQIDATGREDRPGYINNLVFAFELATRPTDPANSQMVLKAPNGFVFEDDCLGPSTDLKLKTNQNDVFGPNTGGVFPLSDGLVPWPSAYPPTACKGNGRDATIYIPIGLQPANRYVFRIRVQNPLKSPSWNKWTLSYNSESSDPFPGFSIWTSVGTPTAKPVSTSRSQGGSAAPIINPVMLTFRPYKNVPKKPADQPKGGCIRVEAPTGFTFVNTNLQCSVDLRVTGSAAAIASDQVACEVDPSLMAVNIYMVGSTQINGEEPPGPGQEYQLIVYVYNPTQPQAAADWHLDTFSLYTREPQYSLDESTIPGFAIMNDLWTYTVTNVLQEFDGNQPVNDVEILLNFRDPIKDGDNITVFAPRGFNIVDNPDLGTCNNYRPVGVVPDWFPFTGAPKCRCADVTGGPACQLYWAPIKEGKDPAFPQKQDIRFQLATINPSKTPFIMNNFWRVEHVSSLGTRLAAQVARSWDITPQLAKVNIKFADSFRSAGSKANLDFSFTPVNDACCIEIQAEFPNEFDFGQSTVAPNHNILVQEGSRIVVNLRSPGLVADTATTLRVFNVKLGVGGGQTRFNLVSYSDTQLKVRMDERLDFTGGFRLPGLVTVLDTPRLTSAWKEAQLLYPVKSLFPPRVGEWATALFKLSFSQAVMAQGKLVIRCAGAGSSKGYTLRTENFLIIGTAQVDAVPVLDSTGALSATLKGNRPATEVALQADTPYSVSLRVFPEDGGTNTWRFDTFDSLGPTNTNNGAAQGFSPVQNFLLTVTVMRSPPKANIQVTLDVDQGTAVVRELVIIAPPGFTFNTGPEGCGDMCTPGQALGSTGRWTATLSSPTGQPLTKLKGLKIQVLTPEQTPIGSGSEGIMWFVEGRGQGAGDTKGWGQGAGFAVTQMSGSAVYYAGVANLHATQIAFTFTLDVDAGSTISVVPPAGFLLTCSLEGSLRTISLPGGQPNCIDDPMQLQLQQPLTAGAYAFVVSVDLPPQTPYVNTFNIIIQDQYNNVVDAAYSIQGDDIVDMGVDAPTLAWSRADPGQPSMVTLGITFTRPTQGIQALLFTLPELFQHDVQIPIDVQNLNKNFPLAAGLDWADTSEPDRIKIYLDTSGDTTTIPVDRYRWSFPILVPPAMPRINLWFFSLCSDRSCKQPSDRQVVVSFPLAGFHLYELAPEALRVSANTAKRRSSLALGVLTLLALFALLALSP